MTHPFIECRHRGDILKKNAKGRDLYRCTHIRNISAEAVLEHCGTCNGKAWSCENCPGWDRDQKRFVYQLERPLPPLITEIVPEIRPLRVIFQTRGWNVGGAERWIASLCQELDPSIIKPTAIAVANWDQRSPVMIDAVPDGVLLLSLDQVRAQWKSLGDMVIHWGDSPIDGKLPTVTVLHHSGANNTYTKRAVKVAMDANVPIVGVNEACRNVLPKSHRDLMTVIHNGADPERVIPTCGRAEIRASFGIRQDQKVVAYIGRIMSDKEVLALAAAVGELPDKWLLLACGPVGSVNDLRAIEVAAKGRMIYKPPRDHVGDFYAAADVSALLSRSEAMPMSVLEAWLAGVPVVATRLPWLKQIEEEHGPLVTAVDKSHVPASVASQIIFAYERQGMKEHAQRIAQEHFTAAAMARRWENYLTAGAS